jgi:hypothetical protein
MPGDQRLIVRPRYVGPAEPSQVWQVIDGATVVGTHVSREDAAKQVLERGARIALTWERSKIGGREGAHDYSAQFSFRDVGRIHKTLDAGGTTYWAWYRWSRRPRFASWRAGAVSAFPTSSARRSARQ